MASTMDANAVPRYFMCFKDMYNSMLTYADILKSDTTEYRDYPGEFMNDMKRYGEFSFREIYVVIIMSISLTILRLALTSWIFIPIANSLRMTKVNAKKFPESVWKMMYYSFTWGYSCYLLIISGKYDYFYRPNDIWEVWTPKSKVPLDIYILYMTQLSFYIHSIYTTIHLDKWRKDSLVMIFHHILTVALTAFSYAVRYHTVGTLVIFLHDACDIFLEFTKINVYLKTRNNKNYQIHEHISTIGFICFTGVWFISRLYFFPLKVLYSTAHGVIEHGPRPVMPFYIFFNTMLFTLLALNLYWFLYICLFLYKVASGQLKEMDDIREDEVVDKMKHYNKAEHAVANGNGHIKVTNGTNGVKKGKAKKTD